MTTSRSDAAVWSRMLRRHASRLFGLARREPEPGRRARLSAVARERWHLADLVRAHRHGFPDVEDFAC